MEMTSSWGRRLAFGYAGFAVLLWLSIDLWADRAWPATIIAFGPRWLAAVPLIPLCAAAVLARGRTRLQMAIPAAAAAAVLLFGFMDFRLGLSRVSAPVVLRVMTHNVGEGQVTVSALDRVMRTEGIDVAALQECPLSNDGMAHRGWYFYSRGDDLCLASRYRITALPAPPAARLYGGMAGEEGGPDGPIEPDWFDIATPAGHMRLLNVHFATIRRGLQQVLRGRRHAMLAFARNRAEAEWESQRTRMWLEPGGEPFLVVGDFNMPVESAIYRANWGDLRNGFSSCGVGFGHTKFTSLFGIRIDHVLMSKELRCAGARVLADRFGGDHAALVVDVVLSPAGE